MPATLVFGLYMVGSTSVGGVSAVDDLSADNSVTVLLMNLITPLCRFL